MKIKKRAKRPLIYKPPPPLCSTQSIAATADSHEQLRSKSRKFTRTLINKFHTLLKSLNACTNAEQRKSIQSEIDELGGLEVYQKASLLGQSAQRGGDTSKWLLKYLPSVLNKKEGIRLLDVGALKLNYASIPWIKSTSIDLNSQTDGITRMDFMEMPLAQFDCICLSLVLNFCPLPNKRGDMLLRTRQFLVDGGVLFIVLPLACVQNSRYTTDDYFVELMKEGVGYELLEKHFSTKLAYYLFRKQAHHEMTDKFSRKCVKRTGQRNNFSITLEI